MIFVTIIIIIVIIIRMIIIVITIIIIIIIIKTAIYSKGDIFLSVSRITWIYSG